jgi:hypothetical protein
VAQLNCSKPPGEIGVQGQSDGEASSPLNTISTKSKCITVYIVKSRRALLPNRNMPRFKSAFNSNPREEGSKVNDESVHNFQLGATKQTKIKEKFLKTFIFVAEND